jgi:hypothetical protein
LVPPAKLNLSLEFLDSNRLSSDNGFRDLFVSALEGAGEGWLGDTHFLGGGALFQRLNFVQVKSLQLIWQEHYFLQDP